MKQVLLVCAALGALTLSSSATADVFQLYDHKRQCSMEDQPMDPYSQAELDNFQACIVAERDAMGRLMNQWDALDSDQQEACVTSSAEKSELGVVSYVEVEKCINH